MTAGIRRALERNVLSARKAALVLPIIGVKLALSPMSGRPLCQEYRALPVNGGLPCPNRLVKNGFRKPLPFGSSQKRCLLNTRLLKDQALTPTPTMPTQPPPQPPAGE